MMITLICLKLKEYRYVLTTRENWLWVLLYIAPAKSITCYYYVSICTITRGAFTYIVILKMTGAAVKEDDDERTKRDDDGRTDTAGGAAWAIRALPTRPALRHPSPARPSPVDRPPSSPNYSSLRTRSRVCAIGARTHACPIVKYRRGHLRRRCYINGQRLAEIEHYHLTVVPARIVTAAASRSARTTGTRRTRRRS